MNEIPETVRFRIRAPSGSASSPFLFGHNLEHTRAAVSGGLSAQMLRNRKFAGKPRKNSGVAAEWAGIGSRVFFQNEGSVVRELQARHLRHHIRFHRQK